MEAQENVFIRLNDLCCQVDRLKRLGIKIKEGIFHQFSNNKRSDWILAVLSCSAAVACWSIGDKFLEPLAILQQY